MLFGCKIRKMDGNNTWGRNSDSLLKAKNFNSYPILNLIKDEITILYLQNKRNYKPIFRVFFFLNKFLLSFSLYFGQILVLLFRTI